MKKQAIFTVDVEGHVGSDPVTSLIYGKTKDGDLCGIDLLMDILDGFKIKGIFFVDIAEAWDYGEASVAGILRHIKERGHTAGVHVHPDHMADPERLFLSEYSREEQYEMIKKCTDFYEKVLGEKPVAFRAGKYGANWDTLDILAKLDYKADFSQFYGQKWCHINPPCAYTRISKLENGLLEIPVTSFKSFENRWYKRFDKIDCEMDNREFRYVVSQMINKTEYDPIVLFAHSFSMLNWRRKPNNPVFDRKKYNRIKESVQYIYESKNIDFVDLNTLINLNNRVQDQSEFIDAIERKPVKMYLFFIERACSVIKQRIDIKLRGLKEHR